MLGGDAFSDSDADEDSDIYALGAVGFHLLTGRRLFETETEHDLTYHVLHEVPRLASECSPFAVPAELDALLVHAPWTRRRIDAWWEQHWIPADSPERRFSSTRY